MDRNLKSVGSVFALVLLGSTQTVRAADDVYKRDGLHVDMGVEVGTGAVLQQNTNFGLGRIDLETGKKTGDAQWAEGYVIPTLGLRLDLDSSTTLFGTVAGVTAATGGDGDAGGFTSAGSDIGLDQAYVGIRTKLFGGKDADGWDLAISGGKQNVMFGDGFLFFYGNFNTGEDRAFWLGPRKAFDLAATVKLESKTTTITGFAVRSDTDSAETEMLGLDTTYTGSWGGVGLFGAHTVGDNGLIAREGMDIVSLRTKDVKVPGIDNLTLSSEIVYQFGDGNGNDYSAYGYYADLSYKFANLPWQPTITYRNAGFSGDRNPFDSKIEGYDPLFYGFVSWTKWFQGEIVGGSMLFNSNQKVHMAKLSMSPTETVGIGAVYYHFDLEEENYFGSPVSSKNFADEVNAYVEWYGGANWYVSGLVGVAVPNIAAKEIFGDENSYAFEVLSIYKY